MSFVSLGLKPPLLSALRELGFTQPTPVQAEAIPAALSGADLQVSAQTGSGKTLAFALPLLQADLAATRAWPRAPHGLVLVPTRELAMQAGELLRDLARRLPDPPRVSVLFGGVSINPQMMGLRGGTELVVAMPGRLLDLVDHNAIRLDHVRTLVLDEADRLLDLGFADELTRVLALLPARRQNLLFSATFPASVQSLADALLRAPVRIDIAPGPVAGAAGEGGEGASAHPDIHERAIALDAGRRTGVLRQLLKTHGWDRVLVFVATRHATELVAHAQQLQDGLGRARQQLDEGAGGHRQPGHRLSDQARHRLRIHLADALGHQLAEDDGDEGDDHHHEGGADHRGDVLGHREVLDDPGRKQPREGRLADDAVEHADRGDADLHRREELGRTVMQRQRGAGAGIAGLGHHLQPRLAAGGQGHLGHGEHAIEQDQREK